MDRPKWPLYALLCYAESGLKTFPTDAIPFATAAHVA